MDIPKVSWNLFLISQDLTVLKNALYGQLHDVNNLKEGKNLSNYVHRQTLKSIELVLNSRTEGTIEELRRW
jgi:hypothetical protein